ncbi:DUF6907 domain-containing protein [Streptomyces sp. CRN 30]|uniref:DUF6907 domain-containing protein n=1 Tax=Streptomyces sp. CRN 30 TaxID=3075613 RepID=UPI002A83CA07|nr:hypothetical protein [Streptomyces sp. CRN 30]
MRNTVPTFPAFLGDVLASADAAVTNPDVARTRACVTVAQAEESAEREAARGFVDRHFPTVAAFLAADAERPQSHDLEPEAAGHFPWCSKDECAERHYRNGETLTEHVSKTVSMRLPDGLTGSSQQRLSAELYASEEFGGVSLGLNLGGEGVPLNTAGTARVIEDLAAFLEGLRALHAQMPPAAAPQTSACSGLAGGCVADHSDPLFAQGEGRCHGPEVRMPERYGDDFPAAQLVQWIGDAPIVNLGQDTPELDVAGVDQLLEDLRCYQILIAALRTSLVQLQGDAR